MIEQSSTVRDTRTLPVVTALVERGLLAPDHRGEAVDVVDLVLASQSLGASPLRRRVAELAGYVGGAFVLSAAVIFLASQWMSLTSGQRVGLLAGIAVVLAGAAAALVTTAVGGAASLRSGHDPVRRRLAGALLTGAAGSAAAAVGVLVDATVNRSDPSAAVVAFTSLAVLSFLGYVVAPTVLGQVAVAIGITSAVPLLFDEFGDVPALAVGLLILGLGVLWLLATEHGLWREVASARVIGCGLVLIGAHVPVFSDSDLRWTGYLGLALVAVAAFAVYVVRPAWPYLAAGVVAVTLVVPEALLDWADNALGPAGVMLATGITLLAASLVGFRLRRNVEAPAQQA
ncbi:MAG: hypothetical protein QOF53_1744 [Nocardioidaceae bacterium]|jgi:MFS family permease|nr:hypothetical protein [Nocardioidaceae bacterium]